MRRVGWDERNVGLLIHNFITHPILVSRVCFFLFFSPISFGGFYHQEISRVYIGDGSWKP